MLHRRLISWLLGGLLALALLVGATLSLWLSPARVRGAVESAASAAAGAPVRVQGGASVALWPRPTLQLGETILSAREPASVSGGPVLLKVAGVRAVARWWPLLAGRFELSSLDVDGLELHLRRDAAGHGNWEGLGAGAADGTAPAVALAAARLRGARIDYEDARNGTRGAIEHLDVTLGAWTAGAPIDIDATFDAHAGGAGRTGGAGTAGGDGGAERALRGARLVTHLVPRPDGWTIGSTRLAATLVVPSAVTRDSAARAATGHAAPLVLEIPQARYLADDSRLEVPGATLALADARLQIRQLALAAPASGPLVARADLELPRTAPRALLAALGQPPIATRDPGALAALAGSAHLELGAGGLVVDPLLLELDATRIAGSLRRSADGVIEFALDGNSMDLDRYREPLDAVSEPFVFPREFLARLRARGTLQLESAIFEGAQARGVTLRLLHAEPAQRSQPAPARPPSPARPEAGRRP